MKIKGDFTLGDLIASLVIGSCIWLATGLVWAGVAVAGGLVWAGTSHGFTRKGVAREVEKERRGGKG